MPVPNGSISIDHRDCMVFIVIEALGDENDMASFSLSPESARQVAQRITLASIRAEEAT